VANLLLLDGSTFFVSQENGDIDANQPEGFFFKDVRHLSEWRLLVDGEPLNPLTSRAVDYFSGRVVAAPEGKDPPQGKDPPLTVERDRFVTEGAHEDIVVSNHSSEERLLELDLCFAADFADVLEAEQRSARSTRSPPIRAICSGVGSSRGTRPHRRRSPAPRRSLQRLGDPLPVERDARVQPARVPRGHRLATRLGDLRRGHAALRPPRARRRRIRLKQVPVRGQRSTHAESEFDAF
jgi:hypothetical protein